MPDSTTPQDERRRRWRLVLGGEDADGLSERDLRIDRALAALYDRGGGGSGSSQSRKAGSAPPRRASRAGLVTFASFSRRRSCR
jgi:hypothetical protein